MPVRRATHAGSWYTDSGPELSRQLEYWLHQADLRHGPARAIIAPHAGYQYCGACAGHAYRQISPVVVRRIFILGPSHHVRLSGCALSSTQKYKTPLIDLHVDMQVNADLEMSGQFEWMDLDTDENEHSIEMHLPYIAKIMETRIYYILYTEVGKIKVVQAQYIQYLIDLVHPVSDRPSSVSIQ